MKKIVSVWILLMGVLLAQVPLERALGEMLMVGFYGTEVTSSSPICQAIGRYDLGGVILFDRNPTHAKKAKNIRSKAQLKRLTAQLQACRKEGVLLIGVDQEGGRVQRLKARYGFYGAFPSAKQMVNYSLQKQQRLYMKMAKELASVGINYNLAPVVDLARNPHNRVIYGLGRSFGKEPEVVVREAKLFMEAMGKYGVVSALKHFPGHGSSLGDTHKGFVDVTSVWSEVELIPYQRLRHLAPSVMVAHIFNHKLDPRYPATLSSKIIQGLLRERIGFEGVVITDDLQMGAITQHYTLNETLALAMNAGNDILLFGNQLDPKHTVSVEHLIGKMRALVKSGVVSKKRVYEAYKHIMTLKESLQP